MMQLCTAPLGGGRQSERERGLYSRSAQCCWDTGTQPPQGVLAVRMEIDLHWETVIIYSCAFSLHLCVSLSLSLSLSIAPSVCMPFITA